jgi:hypothetical protein
MLQRQVTIAAWAPAFLAIRIVASPAGDQSKILQHSSQIYSRTVEVIDGSFIGTRN